MEQPDYPIFPQWPEACHPDRFLLRHVNFGAFEPYGPDTLQRTATYSNPVAAWSAPQQFPLTAIGPIDDREALRRFTENLRVWIEAVPQTDELGAWLAELGTPPCDEPSE